MLRPVLVGFHPWLVQDGRDGVMLTASEVR